MAKRALRKPQRAARPHVVAYNTEICDTAGSIGNWIAIAGLGLATAGLIVGTGGLAGGLFFAYGLSGIFAGGGLAIGLEIAC